MAIEIGQLHERPAKHLMLPAGHAAGKAQAQPLQSVNQLANHCTSAFKLVQVPALPMWWKEQ